MLDASPATRTEEAKAKARALALQGRLRDAVKVGAAIPPNAANDAFERELRDWRHAAYFEADYASGRADWPPALQDPRPDLIDQIPEISAAQLTPEILGGAIQAHGSLIVRGLLTREIAADLLAGIDAAYAVRADETSPEVQSWYAPLLTQSDPKLRFARGFGDGTSMLTVDSPHMLARWLETLEKAGVIDVVTGYLGERPILSAHKTRMYRVPRDAGTQWHQDGAFLGGENTRVVNLWAPLTACGEDAPGLELVPWRLNEIVPPGTHGTHFKWSVGDDKVAEMTSGRPLSSPRFEPGDAMFFDQLCLHRTGARAGMTRGRYAMETWMFAPSTFPHKAPVII